MRKLMWFTLGFGASCAVCVYTWIHTGLLAAAGILLLIGLLGMLIGRWVRPFKLIGLLLLGSSLGLGWFQLYYGNYLGPITTLDGTSVQMQAVCSEYGYPTVHGTAADGYVVLNKRPYKVRLYVKGDVPIEPGDVLSGEFQIKLTLPGGEKDNTYHKGEGIFLLAYQEEDAQLAKADKVPWYFYPQKVRKLIDETIEKVFPEDTAPFAKALLIGDRTDLDYKTNTALRLSGIMHIVAVSGLHVSILFTMIYLLCFKKKGATAICGITTLVLFAAVVGFTPSVTRACIMQILIILAILLRKEYDAPTALAFSCLVMILIDPMVLTSVSFQLSVAAMAGILVFYGSLYSWMKRKLKVTEDCIFRRIRSWLCGAAAASVSAMAFTVPLSAFHFGMVSLVSVVTNLLTLWVVTLVFYGVMVVNLVSLFSIPAAAVVANGVSGLIRYVLKVADLLSRFPLSAVYTTSVYIVVWLVFTYILLAVFLMGRRKRPIAFFCCAALSLTAAVGASWIEPMLDNSRMTVLDVGQGQSLILQSGGRTFLVDCGGDDDKKTADLAAETLNSMGIFRLDGVIVTHYDRDHVGGLPYLLSRMDTELLMMPDYEDDSGTAQELESLVDNSIRVSEDMLMRYDETRISVFAPTGAKEENENSLCILFQGENCDILITGDRSEFGEEMLMRDTDLQPVEILVAGHHGSKYATSEELLDTVSPKIAVISVGENFYGHPAPEVLERLNEHGCVVYRTDKNGTITIRR